ncbi:hypothetical protein CARUB_v10015395mg [Capsella rubella]|uniref:Uncharacterized protein n=2 Tax=Capsella rubella TaxID=81985 RepID=R0HQT6_9BRAS|nr:hypothetical protein CARUB_v10015395mg [Capsella rubella]
MFNPNEVEPMVWPSVEKTRGILDGFFSLPEIEKKKKEMNIESYLKEKTKKVHELFLKTHKKHMGYIIDQLMVQLHRGRRIDDLNMSEIYNLLSFLKDNIILRRNELKFVQYPPLHEPPMLPLEAQLEDLRSTRNNVFVSGGMVEERAWKTNEETERISIGNVVKGNQSQYLIDKWVFPSPLTPKPRNNQLIEMGMVSYNQNPNHALYQGNNTIAINNGTCQESPPNGTIVGEDVEDKLM